MGRDDTDQTDANRERWVVLAALAMEAKAIAPVLRDTPSELYVVGPRAGRLPTLAGNTGIRGVVMAGLAGALDPALKVGDVVIEGLDRLPAAPEGITVRPGRMHTAGQIVATVADKAELLRSTGCAAVDMETDIARRFAASLGVPFVAVRAISDAASESLDPALLQFVGPDGRTRISSVAATLLCRPGLVPQLARLGSNSARAAANLAKVVLSIVKGRTP